MLRRLAWFRRSAWFQGLSTRCCALHRASARLSSSHIKRELDCNLSGNEFEYTNDSILLVKNMLCSKLHCQEGFNPIISSFNICTVLLTSMPCVHILRRLAWFRESAWCQRLSSCRCAQHCASARTPKSAPCLGEVSRKREREKKKESERETEGGIERERERERDRESAQERDGGWSMVPEVGVVPEVSQADFDALPESANSHTGVNDDSLLPLSSELGT